MINNITTADNKAYAIKNANSTERVLVLNGQVISNLPLTEEEKKLNNELARRRARRPPSDGVCIRCKEKKPINRLLLCYPCFVKVNLGKRGWKEGQAHPADCGCDLDCKYDSKSVNN